MAKQHFDRTKPHLNIRDDRSHRPWEDDADGGDNEDACLGGLGGLHAL